MYQGMVPQCVVERQLCNGGLCIVRGCGVVATTRPNVTTETRRYTEDGKQRFEKYVVPLYNEAAEVFHKHGKLIGAHLDGNNRLWAKAVAASGLDYVEAFTPSPDTDMSVADALAAWPGKVLWLNFPSSLHLASIERIKAATRQIVREAVTGNRLIIGITEDIPEDRWQANMLAIARVIDEEAPRT